MILFTVSAYALTLIFLMTSTGTSTDTFVFSPSPITEDKENIILTFAKSSSLRPEASSRSNISCFRTLSSANLDTKLLFLISLRFALYLLITAVLDSATSRLFPFLSVYSYTTSPSLVFFNVASCIAKFVSKQLFLSIVTKTVVSLSR